MGRCFIFGAFGFVEFAFVVLIAKLFEFLMVFFRLFVGSDWILLIFLFYKYFFSSCWVSYTVFILVLVSIVVVVRSFEGFFEFLKLYSGRK